MNILLNAIDAQGEDGVILLEGIQHGEFVGFGVSDEGSGIAKTFLHIGPGAPTVNLNTYIGYFIKGFPGALMASFFFVIPCFVAMVVLAHLYLNYNDVPLVSSLFKGVGALVVGLVSNTIIDLWRKGVNTPQLAVLSWCIFKGNYFCPFISCWSSKLSFRLPDV